MLSKIRNQNLLNRFAFSNRLSFSSKMVVFNIQKGCSNETLFHSLRPSELSKRIFLSIIFKYSKDIFVKARSSSHHQQRRVLRLETYKAITNISSSCENKQLDLSRSFYDKMKFLYFFLFTLNRLKI